MTPLSTTHLDLVVAERASTLARAARTQHERSEARQARASRNFSLRGRIGAALIDIGTSVAGPESFERNRGGQALPAAR